MSSKHRFVVPLRIAASAVLVLSMIVGVAASATGGPSDLAQTRGFRKAVTLAGIREHQAALQAIADDHNGVRVSGTEGFDDSSQYVYDLMAASGYEVSFQEFTFTFVGDEVPPVMEQTAPTPATYVDGVDFATMSYSGSGETTAQLWAVDLIVPSPAPNASTSGCEAADFAGFVAGDIALMQRGTCPFRQKAENAQAAGASAAVIFNEGNPGRTAIIFGTLNPPPMSFPTIGTTFDLGNALRGGVLNGPTGVTIHLDVQVIAEERSTRNVIAETPGGDAEHVVVLGAHLDSVTRGPGINDNGSGSATLLEVAQVFAAQGRETRNKLRFMWYGAEEFGLIGSTYYVDQLDEDALEDIELMLNFDMIGSPNFVRFFYDGDNSAFPVGPGAAEGPPGSGEIEAMFEDYFEGVGLAHAPTPFSGRSDYGPFIEEGIPAGGLFTGAEGGKTAAEAAIFGGTVGAQYDPCYHLACDTFAGTGSGSGATSPGLALTALDQMSDAVAHMALLFSKRNFDILPLVDPASTAGGVATGSSGGGLHDGTEDRIST
jgi:Zn-dependent M28 family amino/carboxypeptidase